MLTFESHLRIKTSKMLKHPYFDEIRTKRPSFLIKENNLNLSKNIHGILDKDKIKHWDKLINKECEEKKGFSNKREQIESIYMDLIQDNKTNNYKKY